MFLRIIHLDKKGKEHKFKIENHYLLLLWEKNDMDVGKDTVLKPAKLHFKVNPRYILFLFTILIKVYLISLILMKFFLASYF